MPFEGPLAIDPYRVKAKPRVSREAAIEKRSIRQIIYKSYKILYRFNSEKIYILHIIHHSRDISNLKF
ncbi:MAG: type II toxin-antitoxin system RelE/ParE family toxin [Clostridia bacterium]|nr:type II toxin-antitoxin system RelE/ParE family toxin [Clostridia bacterium]